MSIISRGSKAYFKSGSLTSVSGTLTVSAGSTVQLIFSSSYAGGFGAINWDSQQFTYQNTLTQFPTGGLFTPVLGEQAIATITFNDPGSYTFTVTPQGGATNTGSYALNVRAIYPRNEFIISFVSESQPYIIQPWKDIFSFSQLYLHKHIPTGSDPTQLFYIASGSTYIVPQGNTKIPINATTYSVTYPSTFTTNTGSVEGYLSGTMMGRLSGYITGSLSGFSYPVEMNILTFVSGTLNGIISGTLIGNFIGTGSLFGNFAGSGSASINGGAFGGWSGFFTSSSVSGTINGSILYNKSYESDIITIIDVVKVNAASDLADRLRIYYTRQNPFTGIIITGSVDSTPIGE